jgi:hypothetical protein
MLRAVRRLRRHMLRDEKVMRTSLEVMAIPMTLMTLLKAA